jgi:hypothetical protein
VGTREGNGAGLTSCPRAVGLAHDDVDVVLFESSLVDVTLVLVVSGGGRLLLLVGRVAEAGGLLLLLLSLSLLTHLSKVGETGRGIFWLGLAKDDVAVRDGPAVRCARAGEPLEVSDRVSSRSSCVTREAA